NDADRTAPTQLARMDPADCTVVPARRESPAVASIGRRRRHQAEIAEPPKREVECARDRRRTQSEDIHLGAKLFDPLFMRDAKSLFFVDDQKAKVLKMDVLGEEAVGADHGIDCSRLESRNGFC